MKRPYPIIIALSALGIFSLILIYTFIPTLLLSAILAYIAYPLYRKMDTFIPRYAAITLCVILTALMAIPLILLTNSLIQESISIINILRDLLTVNQSQDCSNIVCTKIQALLYDSSIVTYLEKILDSITLNVLNNTGLFLTNIPHLALSLFIFLFAFYYALKDGPKLVSFLDKASSQIKGVFTLHLKHMDNVMRAILFGYFAVAFIQGILALIGYAVLGVDNAFFWAALTSMFALLPIIGTAIIWAPLSVFLVIEGVNSSNIIIVKGIILFLYGLFVISTIDNVIRPRIIAARADVHPLTVLLGILGGLQILGPAGFIIGPVILSTTIRMVQDTVNQ